MYICFSIAGHLTYESQVISALHYSEKDLRNQERNKKVSCRALWRFSEIKRRRRTLILTRLVPEGSADLRYVYAYVCASANVDTRVGVSVNASASVSVHVCVCVTITAMILLSIYIVVGSIIVMIIIDFGSNPCAR